MSTLRITAGALRGRRVPVPRGDVRPTSERARQAFFNIAGDRIDGARFLDLFAGSGIFSFEAVSRGAEEAVAIEKSRPQAAAIEKTAGELDANVRVVISDAISGIKRLGNAVFDVIYADPPYDYDAYDELIRAIGEGVALGEHAVVAVEHRRNTEPFADTGRLRPVRRAEYGEVWITFFNGN